MISCASSDPSAIVLAPEKVGAVTSIFLSYARNDDEAFVRRLHGDLTNAGFDVWFDRVSMPARQLTFHQEIRDAIAARDRLLLVVGPGVLASDYVTQEWSFAYFEAGKCVNPIVRLNGHGPDGTTHASQGIDGYELIPEDLKLLHAEDFRDDAHYDAHLANLIRQLSEAIPPVGKLVAVPELPACFLAQPDRIKALRDLLLVDLQKPVVVSGAAARVGLQGMGGIGKSVLASVLAHRPEVRRAFPDGIFWITLGQKPQLAEQQRWLARELGDEALFPDERSGKECLRKLLAGRKALLVLDDVWQREHAEAFNVIGAMGRILLTTRDAGLVTALASKETHYRVELPTEAEAEGIFASAARLDPQALPAAAREIVAQCGRLPLALALCGGMVQGGVSLADVLEALREHDLEFLSDPHWAEEQHQNAWKAMEVSLRVLPPEQRDRFAELAVFALDRGAPEAAVVTLWEHTGGLTPRHARKLLTDFAARSLVQLKPAAEVDGHTDARMTLHDLLHNFATEMAEKQFGSLASLHQMLLDAYAKKCPNSWPSGPDDGYFFQKLCEHLLAAGRLDDAVELLTGLPWIEAKCKAKLVFSLQDDYRNTITTIPEAQEGLRQERERQARLARWTEDITAYSRQWSERRDRLARRAALTDSEPRLPEPPAKCRMWTDEEIRADCRRIIEDPTHLDAMKAFAGFVERECYSLLEFGLRPGFVLEHALNDAPCGSVHHAAVHAFPGVEAPLIMRLWSASDGYNPSPALLKRLEGHTSFVMSVSVTPDGRRAVSVGGDKALRVWDLETGVCLRVLVGHAELIESVSMTPDGRRAVSASWDKTLRVWDLETGDCIRIVEGQKQLLVCVNVTPDGRRAVSAATGLLNSETEDNLLQLWNLETGLCVRSLKGHTNSIKSVSMTPDGRRAVSASWDKTLRVWDLETGDCIRVLEGNHQWITSVSITQDGRRAISAGGEFDNNVRFWDLEEGVCLGLFEGHTGGVMTVAVTPDGKRAVSGSLDRTLRVWDLEAGICLRSLDGHVGGVMSVSMLPDGTRAVSAGGDPDFSEQMDSTVRLWNLETGASSKLQQPKIRIYSAMEARPSAVSVRGSRFIEAGWNQDGSGFSIQVWNLETGNCLQVIEAHAKEICCVDVTQDGRLAVSGSSDQTLRVWDLESGSCLHVLKGHVGEVRGVSATSDGQRVVSVGSDQALRVWDLRTGECLRVLDGNARLISCVCVTKDGRYAVTGGECPTLQVWDLRTGNRRQLLEGHLRRVWRVSMSQDGRCVVSLSVDGTLREWDLESGLCLRVLKGIPFADSTGIVTPESLVAIAAGEKQTLRAWNLQTGACLALARLPAPITSVAFSPALGKVVVSIATGEVLQFELHKVSLRNVSLLGE